METYQEDYKPQMQQLLSLLNDGKEGYTKAAEETTNPELKDLFRKFSRTREKLANEMNNQLGQLSKRSNTSGDFLGKLHRHWLKLKTAISSNDDQMILETCKNGDLAALDAYDDVLQGNILETPLKPFLMNQRIDLHQEFLEIDKRYFDLFRQNPA